jgi:hypothetical protein
MKLKLNKILLLLAMFSGTLAKAQTETAEPDTLRSTVARLASDLDLLKRIKVSGYIQAQFQYADSSGQQSYAGGNFASGVDKRFMLRRARLKVQYDGAVIDKGWSLSQYVFQIDVTERGVVIKDMYAKLTDPWCGWTSLTVGMQNRPFGYEISYSSSLRESPERGRMSQIVFPNERDLGAMVTIQAPKTSRWNWIKLDGGMFNGTGGPGAASTVNGSVSSGNTSNTADFDKYKDFIGHLSINRSTGGERIKFGLGGSYYDGSFASDTAFVYTPGQVNDSTSGFIKSDVKNKKGTAEKRQYMGGDAQFSIEWAPGITTLRGEYIEGDQPGTGKTSTSPAAMYSPGDGIYRRKFNGAYLYFLQNILSTPLQAVVKYDWYDPNTDVAGDVIGKTGSNTGANDIKYTTLGLGLIYRWDANLKITLYYDMVENETSANLKGYDKDLRDNVITARVQVRF